MKFAAVRHSFRYVLMVVSRVRRRGKAPAQRGIDRRSIRDTTTWTKPLRHYGDWYFECAVWVITFFGDALLALPCGGLRSRPFLT